MLNRDTNAYIIIEQQLDFKIAALENIFQGDALTFCGPIIRGADNLIRDAIESISDKRDKLIVVLETLGGNIEVVERIVDTFRHHYNLVELIVPNFALSAGTILVMSGDEIYMDYYSILGPIDPQIERPSGEMVPALGYLIQYDRLIEKAKEGSLTAVELTWLDKFDPAELYQYEQARELSIKLLKDWLAKYKFKNWKITETRKIPVDDNMRKERAETIASELNNPQEWLSHSRGITMEVLRNDLNLKVNDFGEDKDQNEAVRTYYDLLCDYKIRRGHTIILHTNGRYESF